MQRRSKMAARPLVARLSELGLTVTTAESCTGGLVAAAITDVPGSSAVFDRGFVTYADAAKTDLLGVDPALLAAKGAVSAEVAMAMALGALSRSPAKMAVAVTGVAGPDGGSEAKPVGLVHFVAARQGKPSLALERRYTDLGRDRIRRAAVADALDLLDQLSRL